MSRWTVRLSLFAAVAAGVMLGELSTPPQAEAGPIKYHIEQKMLAKPAKKPKAPPPPKKKHFNLHG